MKNVQKIIDLFGGLPALKSNALRIETGSGSIMPLCIEYVGTGPRGLPQVSVAHYYIQHGDAMRDPDVVFELDPLGGWHPVSYQQDGLGLMQEAVFQDEAGRVMIAPRLVKSITSFSKTWSRNLGEQGFLEAAKEQHANGLRIKRTVRAE